MNKNIYLEVLTPVSLQKNHRVLGRMPGSKRVRFGDEDEGVIYLSAMRCNASTMPPRIYAACSTGGGIAHSEQAARALQGRGFSLMQTTISGSELDYMKSESPGVWKDISVGDTIWFLSCHGEVRNDPSLPGGWKKVCASNLPEKTEIVERVEAEPVGETLDEGDSHVDKIIENQTTGALERDDFAPALEFLPDEAISGSILIGGDAGFIPAPESLRKALEACVYFSKLSRSQNNLVKLFNGGGARYSQNRFLQNLIASNAIILGKYAQPVWVTYNSDFMNAATRRQMDEEAELGRTQRGRGYLPDLELFGLAVNTPPLPKAGGAGRFIRSLRWTSKRFPVSAVIIVGVASAAVSVLAYSLYKIAEQYFSSIQGEQALYDDVLERLKDPDLAPAERKFYEDLLKDWGPPSSPNEGLAGLGDIAKYGAIAVAVLAGAWMFGPAIATSVKAGAQRSERKAARQQKKQQQQRKRLQGQKVIS